MRELTRLTAALKISSTSTRSLATVATLPDATGQESLDLPSQPSSSRQTRLPPLPKTPPPTPYHDHVHVPLTPFAPESSTAASRMLVPLPSPLFNTPSRPSLLHRLVIAHLASLRTGNAATKNRSQVNYSGKKVRMQKGSGKARLGSRGSPMLKGGGHAFALTPKGPDGWKRKVNRKEEQLGLRVGLSDKWRAGQLSVVDNLGLPSISTKDLNLRLRQMGWTDALFITARQATRPQEEMKAANAFVLSSGNLPGVDVVEDALDLGIFEILRRKQVVIELAAVDEVIARLDPENKLGLDDTEEADELLDEELMAQELEEALARSENIETV